MSDESRRFRLSSGAGLQFPASSGLKSATVTCQYGHRSPLAVRVFTCSEAEAKTRARRAEDESAKQGIALAVQAEIDWVGFSVPSQCPTCAHFFGMTVEVDVELSKS